MNTNTLPENAVEIKGMSFYRSTRQIYDNIDLNVKRGSIVAIMGPSGIGKTTLLRLIGGQLKPASGSILVDGDNISAVSRADLYEIRKKMGMLFQSGALFSDLSVFDNVAYPLREHFSLPEPIIRNIVLMKLEAVGLRGAANLMPDQLSGGMAKRVALARAIVLDPSIVMFDEPFAGQDPISMAVLVKLIKIINEGLGLTCIVVTHDVRQILTIADYSYVIVDKKILAQGTSDELHQNADPRVRQFLDGKADGAIPFHYPAKDYREDLLGETS